MKKINWLVVTVIGLIVLLFLFGGGMMGSWGYFPFGWIGMAFMWLIPVGFIVLTVLGVAWLAQNLGRSIPSASQSACPNCGKGVQADWKNCPYCGTTLKYKSHSHFAKWSVQKIGHFVYFCRQFCLLEPPPSGGDTNSPGDGYGRGWFIV